MLLLYLNIKIRINISEFESGLRDFMNLLCIACIQNCKIKVENGNDAIKRGGVWAKPLKIT